MKHSLLKICEYGDKECVLIAEYPHQNDPSKMDALVYMTGAKRCQVVDARFLRYKSNTKLMSAVSGKPYAFIDADDVLFDFHSFFNMQLNKIFNLKLPLDFVPQKIDYSDCGEGVNAWKALERLPDSWPAELSVLPHSQLFMLALKNLGFHVSVISAVQMEKVPYRIAALKRAGIYFDSMYGTGKVQKYKIMKALTDHINGVGDIFVDDMLKNGAAVKANMPWIKAYALATTYNSEAESKPGADQVTILTDRDRMWLKVFEDIMSERMSIFAVVNQSI